jgi:sulfur transfer complex TusBCD TusB component (DsrH family)
MFILSLFKLQSLKSSPQTMMAVAKNIILARGLTLRVNTNIKIIRSELYIPEVKKIKVYKYKHL